MQKWEYTTVNVTMDEKRMKLVVTIQDDKRLFEKTDLSKCPLWKDFSNQMGVEGWELAGYSPGAVLGAWSAVFKRPLPD